MSEFGVAPKAVVSGIFPFAFRTPPISVLVVSADVSAPCPPLLLQLNNPTTNAIAKTRFITKGLILYVFNFSAKFVFGSSKGKQSYLYSQKEKPSTILTTQIDQVCFPVSRQDKQQVIFLIYKPPSLPTKSNRGHSLRNPAYWCTLPAARLLAPCPCPARTQDSHPGARNLSPWHSMLW